MTCGFNFFLELEYKRPHKNTRGEHDHGRNYHPRMDPMLSKENVSVNRIPIKCLTCTNHLVKQWFP